MVYVHIKINVYEYVYKIQTPAEDSTMKRVWEELDAYKERGMHDLLRYMIYGRLHAGKQYSMGCRKRIHVASYVLYVIVQSRSHPIMAHWREFRISKYIIKEVQLWQLDKPSKQYKTMQGKAIDMICLDKEMN